PAACGSGDRPGRRLVAMRRAWRRQRRAVSRTSPPSPSSSWQPPKATRSRGRARRQERCMKPYNRPLPVAVGLALLGAPARACAAATATDLDQVVVTGTRTDVALEDSLVPVQVIDRATIERSQATSLPALLQGRAGVNLSRQGGPGKLTSLFLRGTEPYHLPVLVDGLRIGQATNGMSMLQDLQIDQIERVEIVRGPRSSLYGSEAVGGV